MKNVGTILYLILFYLSIVLFIWNFKTFTFQQQVIMFALISGFQCIAALTKGDSDI